MTPLPTTQLKTLQILARVDHVTSESASAKLGVLPRTARNYLARLVDMGYAERIPTERRGAALTRITETGLTRIGGVDGDVPDPLHTLKTQQRADRVATAPNKYAPYTPPPMQSVRPGADDHLKYKSRGIG